MCKEREEYQEVFEICTYNLVQEYTTHFFSCSRYDKSKICIILSSFPKEAAGPSVLVLPCNVVHAAFLSRLSEKLGHYPGWNRVS